VGKYYPQSKVEVGGLLARHYDRLMDVMAFGRYRLFIERVVRLMNIKPADRIIDFATGTGRNVSEAMISQFRAKCRGFPNAEIVNQRIDHPLRYEKDFDKAFVSFTLHGFPQQIRVVIIDNAFRALRSEGELFILDYNEFSLSEMPWYIRLPFRMMECPYAFDFISRDWKRIMRRRGFGRFIEHVFFGGYVRLLKAVKIARAVEVAGEA